MLEAAGRTVAADLPVHAFSSCKNRDVTPIRIPLLEHTGPSQSLNGSADSRYIVLSLPNTPSRNLEDDTDMPVLFPTRRGSFLLALRRRPRRTSRL
jgi:hypothetical protein